MIGGLTGTVGVKRREGREGRDEGKGECEEGGKLAQRNTLQKTRRREDKRSTAKQNIITKRISE